MASSPNVHRPLGAIQESMPLNVRQDPPEIHHVQSRLYLGLGAESEVIDLASRNLAGKHMTIDLKTLCERISSLLLIHPHRDFVPSPLTDLYLFDAWIQSLFLADSGRFVFCPGLRASMQVRVCFLLGSHLIMTHGIGFEEVYLSFRPLHALFNHFSTEKGVHSSICKAWRALCASKCIGWINFCKSTSRNSSRDRMDCIDLEEMVHYARYYLLLSPRFTLSP